MNQLPQTNYIPRKRPLPRNLTPAGENPPHYKKQWRLVFFFYKFFLAFFMQIH